MQRILIPHLHHVTTRSPLSARAQQLILNTARRRVSTKPIRNAQPAHPSSSTTLPPSRPPQATPTITPPTSPTPRLPLYRSIPLVLGSLLAGGIAFYAAQLAVAAQRPPGDAAIATLAGQRDVTGRYEDTADGFDAEVGVSEALMGVNRLRRRLVAARARGHVLEVACGTGRNLGYFDLVGDAAAVESLTLVDISPAMVEVCRKKWDVLFGGRQKRAELRKGLVVRFLAGSALGLMPGSPKESGKYDTVVQTMGLCSTPQPVELIENMTRYLDMNNEDSRILLLEHGRSYKPWLNNILDSSAEKHAEIHGCWFNRDIGNLVGEAAAKSGLEVVQERRHHFGTTWVFELKPKAKSSLTGSTTSTSVSSSNDENVKTDQTWRSWLPFK